MYNLFLNIIMILGLAIAVLLVLAGEELKALIILVLIILARLAEIERKYLMGGNK